MWCVLGIPGVWWIDIQVDGVRRGYVLSRPQSTSYVAQYLPHTPCSSLASMPKGRMPDGGSVIASSHTSPLDILYLGCIFDPIFTQSLPDSRLVRPLSLEAALAACFDVPAPAIFNARQPPATLSSLVSQNPDRVIVVFPETTTSNGRGILKFSPSLLSAASSTKIYPVSLRYTPQDIVTPVPGWLEVARFIWRLNSQATHCIRVRVGGVLTLSSPGTAILDTPPSGSTRSSARASPGGAARRTTGGGFDTNFFDTLDAEKVAGDETDGSGSEAGGVLSEQENRILDAVAEALARLGRVKRVGLGREEKEGFVKAWADRRNARK